MSVGPPYLQKSLILEKVFQSLSLPVNRNTSKISNSYHFSKIKVDKTNVFMKNLKINRVQLHKNVPEDQKMNPA